MLNRSTTDLASASIRIQYFQSRSAADIAADMPLLPVDAPGLPQPGPSFVRAGKLLGDPQPPPVYTKTGKVKKTAKVRPTGPYLTALIRACLYQLGTTIPVGPDDQHAETFTFMPGVLMNGSPAGDPYGPGPCRLMVVGKCLGRSEVESERPFVGRGSQPLWTAWGEAGIPQPSQDFQVFCTNLVRFEPPLSMMTRFPKEVVQDGLHLLFQEIALCRPEVILCVGADALKAVLGAKAKVSDYVGRTGSVSVDCRPTPDTPPDVHTAIVVAADHPARVARDPELYPQFLAAMKRTSQLLGFTDPPERIPLDHQKVLTLAELKAAVLASEKASANGGYISFDCEWQGKHPTEPDSYVYTVQWSHAPGHARSVFLRHCGGALNASLPLDKARPWLQRLLEKAPDRGARLVAHFGKADLPWLYSLGVDLYDKFVGPDHDTTLSAGDRTYFEGGFDSYVAAHATEESERLKLEILAANRLGIDRYDAGILAWRDTYCKEQDIRKSQLRGYGNCPEDLIAGYGMLDSDVTGRLYLLYNGDPRTGTRGLLDCDRFGNSSRKIFGLRMRAWGAWAEMERYGLEVDRQQHRTLRDQIVAKKEELLAEFRSAVAWPDFAPTKTRHKVEFLFGEAYNKDGKPQRPQGGVSLYLKPYKSTKASGGRLWDDAVFRANRDGAPTPTPAADKETTVILSRQNRLVALLKDIDLLTTAMKIMFRLPVDTTDGDEEEDEETAFATGIYPEDPGDPEDEVHDAGFISLIDHDGRIRSVFGLVETGRASSSRPNLQNGASDGIDEQYDRILGQGKGAPEGAPEPVKNKFFKTKSAMRARAGWFLVSADLMGAEIAAAGWDSGDQLLIEHARRATLPETDPDWLDLHADLAKSAFKLGCTMREVKKLYKALRTAAKRARFGHYYGASPDSIYRKALEDDPNVTLEDVVALVKNHDEIYPVLANCFAATRRRVTTHGWFKNGYGGNRRFRPATDRDRIAGQEREAQNWLCQGLVADNITSALGNCFYYLRREKMQSRIVLSIHDSIMLECPPWEVDVVVDDLLPRCMSTENPVPITDLDGNPLNRGPYHFGIDTAVYRSWGVEVEESDWRAAAADSRKVRATTA